MATSADALTSGVNLNSRFGDAGQRSREKLAWGSVYVPKRDDADGLKRFGLICDDLIGEINSLAEHLTGGILDDEFAGPAAEINSLLKSLYNCPFGQGESLKSIVVLLQSQLNNAEWTARHVNLLRSTMCFLRVRNVLNDQTVAEIRDMIKESGLNIFRGSITDVGFVSKYRVQKVEAE